MLVIKCFNLAPQCFFSSQDHSKLMCVEPTSSHYFSIQANPTSHW